MSEPRPLRFAIRAAFLVVPLVLAAVAQPHVRRWATAPTGPGPGAAVPAARQAVRAAEQAAAASARQADAALGDAPAGGPAGAAAEPPRRDGPTVEEIEANRAAQEALAEAQRGWKKVEVLAPRPAVPDASGELVSPFQGFGLSVDSRPAGATVLVDGLDQGQTPLLTTVDCRPGEPVQVRLVHPGRRPVLRSVRCRQDALVSFTATLPP